VGDKEQTCLSAGNGLLGVCVKGEVVACSSWLCHRLPVRVMAVVIKDKDCAPEGLLIISRKTTAEILF